MFPLTYFYYFIFFFSFFNSISLSLLHRIPKLSPSDPTPRLPSSSLLCPTLPILAADHRRRPPRRRPPASSNPPTACSLKPADRVSHDEHAARTHLLHPSHSPPRSSSHADLLVRLSFTTTPTRTTTRPHPPTAAISSSSAALRPLRPAIPASTQLQQRHCPLFHSSPSSFHSPLRRSPPPSSAPCRPPLSLPSDLISPADHTRRRRPPPRHRAATSSTHLRPASLSSASSELAQPTPMASPTPVDDELRRRALVLAEPRAPTRASPAATTPLTLATSSNLTALTSPASSPTPLAASSTARRPSSSSSVRDLVVPPQR